MAQWPLRPEWWDPRQLNNGQEYTAGDGLTAEAINRIAEDLLYLYQNGGGGGGGGEVKNAYRLRFINGGDNYCIYEVPPETMVYAPARPAMEGQYFQGWYDQNDDPVTFPFVPTFDMTIFARWGEETVIGFKNMSMPSGDLELTGIAQGAPAYEVSGQENIVTVTSTLDGVWPFNAIHEVQDDQGNTFVSFPKMYMQWVKNEDGVIDGVNFSTSPQDDTWFIPDCFLDPRDDNLETYLDEILIGKYEASSDGNYLKSATGVAPVVNVSRTTCRTRARAYGFDYDHYKGYQQYDFSTMILYNLLCCLYYRTLNIQKVYKGRTDKSSAANTGATDSVQGLNGWDTTTGCVKMLGVENPYGNIYKWVDGIIFSSANIYVHRNPTKFADSTSGGLQLDITRPTSSNYWSYAKAATVEGGKCYMYPSSLENGGADKYSGDYCSYSSGNMALHCGGSWGGGSGAGLWGLYGNNSASTAYSALGARLCRRPIS